MQSDLELEKYGITLCIWIWLSATVSMVMTFTNFCNCFMGPMYNTIKFIRIKYFLEWLTLY